MVHRRALRSGAVPGEKKQNRPALPGGFVFSHQPSAISHQPSAISHQPSAISHQPSANVTHPCH
jgi:hypothetical protein